MSLCFRYDGWVLLCERERERERPNDLSLGPNDERVRDQMTRVRPNDERVRERSQMTRE